MAGIKNMFLNGIDMSFNPISTPDVQNSLFTALNATTMTKIGNEMVLQQDLGNGRVESAHLPNGYIPLGIKEHGGVIYIVSYNPITKHGQVGSFPSPERNISSLDINGNTDQVIDWTRFYDDETGIFKTHERLFPLGEDSILNPGDEFLLYFIYSFTDNQQKVNELIDLITLNDDMKLIKFKLYARIDNGNLIDLTDNEIPSENVRKVFDLDGDGSNDYQIYFDENNNFNINEFLANFSRNESPYLVWNKKFKGKLVLSVDVEVVDSFNVSIDTEKDPLTGDIILSFIPSVDKEHNKLWNNGVMYDGENIKIDGEGEQYKGGIKVEIENNISGEKVNYFDCYDEDENKYTIRISDYDSDSIFKYNITPYMYCGELDNLKISGAIDLKKVNTGIYELTKWRYYNQNVDSNPIVNLMYSVDYYPKKGNYISDVTFRFTNLLKSTSPILIKADGGTKLGTYSQEINGLLPDSLYMVEMIITERDSNGKYVERNDSITRVKYLNTTEMYNGYLLDDSILDYTILSPDAKMIAESKLAVNKVNINEDNILDKDNVYMSLENDLYGCIYNNNKYRVTNRWEFKSKYNLFNINISNNDVDTTYEQKLTISDRVISTTKNTDSSFDGVQIDDNEYTDESDIETLMSTKRNRANIWDVFYNDETDYYYYIHNAALCNAGNKDKSFKKMMDINYLLSSLTSSEFAKSLWGSVYEDKNGNPTINYQDIVEGITGEKKSFLENEYIAGNYNVLFGEAYKQQTEGLSNVKNRYNGFFTYATNDSIKEKISKDNVDTFPLYAEGKRSQFAGFSSIAIGNWQHIFTPYVFINHNNENNIKKESLKLLTSKDSYPVATLNCVGVGFVNNNSKGHNCSYVIDEDPAILKNRIYGIRTADYSTWCPVFFYDEASTKWYGTWQKKNNNVFSLEVLSVYSYFLGRKYSRMNNYFMDNRDVCFFSFSSDPETNSTSRYYSDINLFCSGIKYLETQKHPDCERYASTTQDIVALPARYEEVWDNIEIDFGESKNFLANRNYTGWNFIFGIVPGLEIFTLFPFKQHNKPTILGKTGLSRYSHVDSNACQGKPVLNLFSKIYAAQIIKNKQIEFYVQDDISYDDKYKLSTIIKANLNTNNKSVGVIYWNNNITNSTLKNTVNNILNNNKDITVDGLLYQYYSQDVCDVELTMHNNLIIEHNECSLDNDNIDVVSAQKEIITNCPDTNKLVNMFISDQNSILYLDADGRYTMYDAEGIPFDINKFYANSNDIDGYEGSNGIVALNEDMRVNEITEFNAYDKYEINFYIEDKNRDFQSCTSLFKDSEMNGNFNVIRKIQISFNPNKWVLKNNSKINQRTVCVNPSNIGDVVTRFGIQCLKAGENSDKLANRKYSQMCIAAGDTRVFDYDKRTEELRPDPNPKPSGNHKKAYRDTIDDDVSCYEMTSFIYPDPKESFIEMYDLFDTIELTNN